MDKGKGKEERNSPPSLPSSASALATNRFREPDLDSRESWTETDEQDYLAWLTYKHQNGSLSKSEQASATSLTKTATAASLGASKSASKSASATSLTKTTTAASLGASKSASKTASATSLTKTATAASLGASKSASKSASATSLTKTTTAASLGASKSASKTASATSLTKTATAASLGASKSASKSASAKTSTASPTNNPFPKPDLESREVWTAKEREDYMKWLTYKRYNGSPLTKAEQESLVTLSMEFQIARKDWVKIHVKETVRVQSDPVGKVIITGEPEQLDNPWGITPFKKVVGLATRINPLQTSAVMSMHGRLFVRAPFEK